MIKILSIDDSKAVHAYLETCFDEEKYEIIHAYSALEALKILQTNPKQFDIILLDWEMPAMTGPEALVEMKKMGISQPIVMVTTRNNQDEIRDVLEKGATEYIMKPFTPDIIQQKVDEIIGL